MRTICTTLFKDKQIQQCAARGGSRGRGSLGDYRIDLRLCIITGTQSSKELSDKVNDSSIIMEKISP